MPTPRSRLTDTERLLVDGTNLLHAIRRRSTSRTEAVPASRPGAPSAPAAVPAAALIGRLRGVIEMPIRIELILDGPPHGGVGDTRVASGVTVRHSGRTSADSVIMRLVAEAEHPATLLVVTDDAELTDRVRRAGGRVARSEWLLARLERARLVAPTVGRPRPPAPATNAGGDATEEEAAHRRWRPGRGATRKHGNPRRAPRADRPTD